MNIEQTKPEPGSEPEQGAAEDHIAVRGAAASENVRGQRRESQAGELVKIVRTARREGTRLFHDGEECYVVLPAKDHVETLALKSRSFRRWLGFKFFEATGRMPSSEALATAINTLAGIALFQCDSEKCSVRIAERENRLYLDLADDGWRVVEVDRSGWRVLSSAESPVRFRRPSGMLALPEPERGGSIEDLRTFLNVENQTQFRLLIGWLVGALGSTGPYPVLIQHSEHGSAKTTRTRVLRELIDPNQAPLRGAPKSESDLMIAATNGWIVAFDNLSKMPAWLSDALCRLATGGGLSTRALYTDSEETILAAQRPVMINGIEELAIRGDLLDRAIVVTAPPIAEHDRKPEKLFYRDFYAARPRIMGVLLDAVSCALRNVARVQLERTPRMADFTVWVEAATPSLRWKSGEFVKIYDDNREQANAAILETAFAQAVLKLSLPWAGTATELHQLLGTLVDGQVRRLGDWPKSGRAVSNSLRRITPNLRAVGIIIERGRQGHGRDRTIEIRRAGRDAARRA